MILTARSGTAINITLPTTGVTSTIGRSFPLFQQMCGGQIRPSRVTSINPPDDRLRFPDVNAFQLQPINVPGNAGRNIAWSRAMWKLDIGLTRRFNFTEIEIISISV